MKKLAILGAVAMIAGGVALGSSLSVPWFNDDAPVGYPPTSGTAAFIGLHNNTNQGIPIFLTYKSDQFNPQTNQVEVVDLTPTDHSFILPANMTVSFRPCVTDPNEGPVGMLMPNMNASSLKWGTLKVEWTGGATDVQGRLLEFRPSTGVDASSYTLPPGAPTP